MKKVKKVAVPLPLSHFLSNFFHEKKWLSHFLIFPVLSFKYGAEPIKGAVMTEDEARIHLIALQLVDHEIMSNLLRFTAESQPDKKAFLAVQKEMVMKFLSNSNMNDPHLLNVSAELAANVFWRAGLED